MLEKINKKGFAVLEGLIIVVLLVAIVGIGTYIYKRSNASNPDALAEIKSTQLVKKQTKHMPPSFSDIEKAKKQESDAELGLCEPDTGACYYYAGAYLSELNATGGSATFTVANPKLAVGESHTLTELSLADNYGNIVEVGWTVDRSQFGDTKPRLFVFYWDHYQPGCYNVCAFTPTSQTIRPGQALTTGVTGNFKIEKVNEKWKIYLNDEQIGYYPASTWGGSFTKVNTMQTFGEVSAFVERRPLSDMGNGKYPASGTSAVISKIKALGQTNKSPLSYYALGAPRVYKVLPRDQNCTESCRLRYGGPGF